MENTKVRYAYRLPPCPSYDVPGMERWLSDMAKKGMLLLKDGFFCGVATFEKGEPREVKYRLEPADGEVPPNDALELYEKYSWEFLVKRGGFFIYRSPDPGARELNTDRDVQALSLNKAKRRQYWLTFEAVFWFIIYPLIFFRRGLFLTMIGLKTWFVLLAAFIALWLAAGSLAASLSLRKLQINTKRGIYPMPSYNAKKEHFLYYVKRILKFALISAFVCILLHSCGISITDADKTPLKDYGKVPPFASINDFAGSDGHTYRRTMDGMGEHFNSVREWRDILSPLNMEWIEHAELVFEDGSTLSGGLYIYYHETASRFIARKAAEEYVRADRRAKQFAFLPLPDISADFSCAYIDYLQFPTVVIQKGNTVVRARFYQIPDGRSIELSDWASVIADSIP